MRCAFTDFKQMPSNIGPLVNRAATEARMSLTKRSVETILDLVEIKLNSMQVIDREDARELEILESCRRELLDIRSEMGSRRMAMAAAGKRGGRGARVAAAVG
jgi:hypothetical protein